MSEKYLIFGATGSIGSSLAEQLVNSGNTVHLVGRNENETKNISEKLGCTFTIADVLENGFIETVKNDISDIKGIAYCVGSIDLKPLRMVNEQDFNKCMKLNLYSAVEAIKGYQESLKKNKGSVVLFSTVAAGERGKGMIAQDPSQHPGSIIRIHLDGRIPKDNPKFGNRPNWLPEIYQIGIRNPQGLTLSPFDGKIYMSNHGAKGGDWFGEAKKGENYGWKILGWGGKNYSGIPIGPKWKPGFTKAIQYWVPSIATSAITIYKGDEFKEWNGHALITSLKDKSLRKLIFKNTSNVKEEIIFRDKIGRIRDIQIHPINGKIYFLAGSSLWLMEK